MSVCSPGLGGAEGGAEVVAGEVLGRPVGDFKALGTERNLWRGVTGGK